MGDRVAAYEVACHLAIELSFHRRMREKEVAEWIRQRTEELLKEAPKQ